MSKVESDTKKNDFILVCLDSFFKFWNKMYDVFQKGEFQNKTVGIALPKKVFESTIFKSCSS